MNNLKTAKPDWLKVKIKADNSMEQVENIMKALSLYTVCEEAKCPNRCECYGRKTATFMILGNVCTRNCKFCNVTKGSPGRVDDMEPIHVAEAVRQLGLKHVVITSVTRDDLEDGGASQFAAVIREIRNIAEHVIIEVLIPDFKGDSDALSIVVEAKPDIINHNIETISRLYPSVRPMAFYERSLELLDHVKKMDSSIHTKSGLMVGLGERFEEVAETLSDLRDVDCDFLTIGQYLAPSSKHHEVVEYVHPDIFEKYKGLGNDLGFSYIASAPFVRSSYMAEKALKR